MIDAGKFSKPLLSDSDPKYFRFGIASPTEIANILRAMANDIESGLINIQRVQTGHIADIDEFYMQCLLIEFAEVEAKSS